MSINKGDCFLCIKTVEMIHSAVGQIRFYAGNWYDRHVLYFVKINKFKILKNLIYVEER